MGASLALAGVTGCTRQPRETIVPYVKQPEEIVLGKPLFFATAATLRGYAQGILVESHEGRPTKIEGNPDHPASLGATDVFGQASVSTSTTRTACRRSSAPVASDPGPRFAMPLARRSRRSARSRARVCGSSPRR